MTIAGTSGPEAHWRAALAEGRFLLPRAGSRGTVYFPPRLAEPRTRETDLVWIEASGMGRSDGRPVGKVCVRSCCSWWSPSHYKKNILFHTFLFYHILNHF